MSAVITGASSGIGRALALEMAKNGHEVVVVGRDVARLNAVADEIRKLGVGAHVIAADLSRPDGPSLVVDTLRTQKISVDILVNNAGFGVHGDFASTPLEKEFELVQLQIPATLALVKAFLPDMIRSKKGRIVNVSSVYGYSAVPFQSVYSACKSFLVSFSQSLASEVAPHGITVTVVCPGVTRSEFRSRAGIREKKKTAGMSSEDVAVATYRGMMAGKRVVVPGFVNQLFVSVMKHLPGGAMTMLMKLINSIRGVNHSPTVNR